MLGNISLFQRGFAPSRHSGTFQAGAVDIASKFIPQYVIYTLQHLCVLLLLPITSGSYFPEKYLLKCLVYYKLDAILDNVF